jgi:hypothetical protein
MRMDNLDRLLKYLPPEDLPTGLTKRACLNFRRRRIRQQRIHLVTCLALIALGMWLGGPGLLDLGAHLQSGGSGVSLLDALISSLFDAGNALTIYTHSTTSIQSALNDSLGITAWVGILALVAGAWVGMSGLLSRSLR